MNCQSCNATLIQVRGQQHAHCQSCNKFHFPTALELCEDSIQRSGKKTDFQCPKCEQKLEVGKLRGMLDVCFCENCRGFVIDSESLGPVINDLRSRYQGPDDQPIPINPAELDLPSRCPACLESMDVHPYYGPGNALIDTCMHCKLVWFDHGELARIVRAPGTRPGGGAGGNFESPAIRSALNSQSNSRAGAELAMLFFGR